jgi:hypothetical protein
MSIAIMQPYIFPYIGYFQLVAAVKRFVFYDDVNFIKQGWINRNRVLVNGYPFLFTVPVESVSSFTEIKDVKIHERNFKIWHRKFVKSLVLSYGKCTYFEQHIDLVRLLLEYEGELISEMAINSVTRICEYLDVDTSFACSSKEHSDTKGLQRADRLIAIVKGSGYDSYINPIGGGALYQKEYFQERGVALNFMEPLDLIQYSQQNSREYVPWLSIIDILMNNSKEDIKLMLAHFRMT